MKNITLGLGILIGHIFIRQFYGSIAHLFVGPKVDRAYQLVMLSSELSIIIGVVISAYLLKKYNVKERITENPPGVFYIKLGVAAFLITWIIFLVSRFVPYAAYFFASFSPVQMIFMAYSYIVYAISNMLIGYGLFLVLLSAKSNDS